MIVKILNVLHYLDAKFQVDNVFLYIFWLNLDYYLISNNFVAKTFYIELQLS